jgi:aminopeptidase-like protein
MANNELSGPTVLTYLIKWLLNQKNLRYSYRIVFIPETIGSITYLSQNYKELKKNVFAGFNISCVGDDRGYSYIPSRNGNTVSDNVARHVLKWIDSNYVAYTWSDRASDERQYCAPGIDLPIASVCRTKYHCYPEYHTSLDDLENVVTPEGLQGGYNMLRKILETVENNIIPQVNMLCEPQLGKRGLYADLSKFNIDHHKIKMIMMDFISWCDGEHTLLEISEKLNVPIWELYDLCNNLEDHEIISITSK